MWIYVQIIFLFVSKNLCRATVYRIRDANCISFCFCVENMIHDTDTVEKKNSHLLTRNQCFMHSALQKFILPFFNDGNTDVQKHHALSIRARMPSSHSRIFLLFGMKQHWPVLQKRGLSFSPRSDILFLGLLSASSSQMCAMTLLPDTWPGPLQKGGDAKAVDYKAVVDTAQACIALGVPRLVIVSSGGVSKPDSSIYLLLNLFGQIMENKFKGRSYCRVPALDRFLPVDEFIAFSCLKTYVVQRL